MWLSQSFSLHVLLGVSLSFVSGARLSQEPLQDGVKHHLHLTHDLIGLHKNLTEIESISGNEEAVGKWLAASLQSQGYHTALQHLQEEPARFNILAWPGNTRDAKVLLSSHIDTVKMPVAMQACQMLSRR